MKTQNQIQLKKNTFKRIIFLDHAIGLLRYVACSQGKVSRRGADGLLLPQRYTHFVRQPISQHIDIEKEKNALWLEIGYQLKLHDIWMWKKQTNWNAATLHGVKECVCDRGGIGMWKRKK